MSQPESDNNRTAVLAGASGLVGGYVLNLLLASPQYRKVISIGRRKLPVEHPKLEQRILEFTPGALRSITTVLADYYCCLGTTIRKAGSKAAFRKVDLEYPLALARHAVTQSDAALLVVTALGAETRSLFFYNQVKGELEKELGSLPLSHLSIFRPSLLLGERDEQRTGELLAQKFLPALSPLLIGPLRKYRPIEAATVAKVMVKTALDRKPGIHEFDSDEIQKLANV